MEQHGICSARTILCAGLSALFALASCSANEISSVNVHFHDAAIFPVADVSVPVEIDAQESDVTNIEDGTVLEDMGAPDVIAADVTEPPTLSGETIGDAIAFSEEDLDRVYLFGLGVEPGSPMGMIGNTTAGVLALPASLIPNQGWMEIRVYDWEQQAPLAGNDYLIESYPYTMMEDGRYLVDFGEPGQVLEVQVWDSCRYETVEFDLAGAPLYEDGLITWPAVERFEPNSCGFNVPPTEGVHVHFLRVMNQESSFEPREVDPDQPFGFFEVEHEGKRIMTRLPGIGGQYLDGTVTYAISGDVPYNLTPVIKDIFDYWNDTLELTIGQRPFVLSDAPSPALVPWDPRFRVVSFDMSQSISAVAPFIADPITGEMFETDVLIWLGDVGYMFESYKDALDDFPELYPENDPPGAANQHPIMPPFDGRRAQPTDPSMVPARVLKRTVFDTMPGQKHLSTSIPTATAVSLTSDELLRFIVADFFVHEVGHNLGLRHNFIGSADRSNYEVNQSSTSVMDYVIGMPRPGTYDEDAMRYGYGDGALDDSYLYCTDEGVPFNPACTRWDLGHPLHHLVEKLLLIRDRDRSQHARGRSQRYGTTDGVE